MLEVQNQSLQRAAHERRQRRVSANAILNLAGHAAKQLKQTTLDCFHVPGLVASRCEGNDGEVQQGKDYLVATREGVLRSKPELHFAFQLVITPKWPMAVARAKLQLTGLKF